MAIRRIYIPKLSVSGTGSIGSNLTSNIKRSDFVFEWRRNGVAIASATANNYTLTSTDAGTTISLHAYRDWGTSTYGTINTPIPSYSTLPSFTGNVYVGQTLTADHGTWLYNPTSYAYQWKRNGTAISNATNQTYVLTSTDIGTTISVTVTATNSAGSASATSISSATITTTPVTTNIDSNPITYALTGTRTFNVGTGQTYPDLDTVPWSSLVAGDVVNIYYRSTPYNHKIGIAGIGTQTSPIIINGVTDSNGNRPIINGAGAKTAAGSMTGTAVFAAGSEGYGIITIKRPPSVSSANDPAWISIKNIELTGATYNGTHLNYSGTSATWGFSAAIWCQPSKHITVENCVVYGNAQGFFSMVKVAYTGTADMGETCEYITLRYNRMYGNGSAGNMTCHNVYLQSWKGLVEGNYFGQLTASAQGSTYKSRGSNETFRYNYVDASLRAMDFVQPDIQGASEGIVLQSSYGPDWVYGNVIVNDASNSNGNGLSSWRIIHYGGDTEGEQWSDSGSVLTAPISTRQTLYFFNNTLYSKSSGAARQYMLQLSFSSTVANFWNNILYFKGTSITHLLQDAGTLNFYGTNVLYSDTSIVDVAEETIASYARVNRYGTLLTADPGFTASDYYDFTLASGSNAIDAATTPTEFATISSNNPIQYQPKRQLNGLFTRTQVGSSNDLGAYERDPSAGVAYAPALITQPAITGVSIVGNTLSCSSGTWIYTPTSYAYQWQQLVSGSWTDISGATTNTFTLTSTYNGGTVRCRVVATNSVGSTTTNSNQMGVTTTAPATIVQYNGGYDSSGAGPSATMASNPTIGNTLIVFASISSAVSDNFGNTYTKQQDINYSGNVRLAVWTTVVTATGSNFKVSATSTGGYTSSVGVYEVAGTYSSSTTAIYSTTYDTTGVASVSISANANTLVIGGVCMGPNRSSDGLGPTASSGYTTDLSYSWSVITPSFGTFHGITSLNGSQTVPMNPNGTYWSYILVQIAPYVVVAPTNSTIPTITGSTQDGSTVTATVGTWSNSPTAYAYQWNRNGTSISGATSQTYTLTTADVGTTLTVTVTASNSAGSATATSSGVTVSAANTLPVNSVAPTISGSTTSGSTVTATVGTWSNSPTAYAYQWNRNGTAISGATSQTYVLTATDVGTTVTVTVTATNASGSGSATSSGISVTAAQLAPNANGVFDFTSMSTGVILSDMNTNIITDPTGRYSDMNVDSGHLRGTSAAFAYGTWVLYNTSHTTAQSSKAKITTGLGSDDGDTTVLLIINYDITNGTYYYLKVAKTAYVVKKSDGTTIDYVTHGVDFTTTSPVFEIRNTGSQIQVYTNGSMTSSYTDASPLSGGVPGFSFKCSTSTISAIGLDKWTDQSSATL